MSANAARTVAGRKRPIALWLFGLAGLVFLMVVLGGATRLTHSGLSMVEWRPLTGWLPPLTEKAWQATFDAYKQYPEYQQINRGITLAEFQGIFWLEYVHRLTGRLMGVVFLLPFVFFLVKGHIDRPLGLKLGCMFVLGALQGVLGWLMVKSGMVDRPDVSQYRLVAHLLAALAIYALIFWTALDCLAAQRPAPAAAGGLFWGAVGVNTLILLTIAWGGFVAGTDAGFAYNTFPLMDGELVPSLILPHHPILLNFVEDVTTIQFTHRVLATVALLAVVAFFVATRNTGVARRVRLGAGWLLAATAAQYGLGVATVVLAVPVPLGITHQAGAVVVWSLALWIAFETSRGASRMHGHAAPLAAEPFALKVGRVVRDAPVTSGAGSSPR